MVRRTFLAWCGFGLVVSATLLSAQPQPRKTRLVIQAKATGKLSAALAAAKAAGGTLVGTLDGGRAVVEVADASAEKAKARIARLPGVVGVETRVPAKFEPVDRLIVAHAPGRVPALGQAGLKVVGESKPGHFVVARLSGGLTARTIAGLEKEAAIRFLEPDFRVRLDWLRGGGRIRELVPWPNDPDYGRLWGMKNINAPKAWKRVTKSKVTVAILDTGIDYRHEDLKANLWRNPGEVAGDGRDNDGNGIRDDVHGAFTGWPMSGDPADADGHGTHVAGTIGAVGNNSRGVTGVSWDVKLMALKWIRAGWHVSDVVRALDYAIAKRARVVNNSWRVYDASFVLQEAVNRTERADILMVCAAGNERLNIDATPCYPAAYANRNILTVMAIDEREGVASFSNYGPRRVHLAAPGVNIHSTLPGNRYGALSGTSMAAPHVSGAAALVWGHPRHATKSAVQVKKLLMDNARVLSSLSGKCVTRGTLDLSFLGSP